MANAIGLIELADHSNEKPVPLVIDLDGTLVRSDLFIENAFATIGQSPQAVQEALRRLWRGLAHLKEFFADAKLTPALLPYDSEILTIANDAIRQGRPVYLASAANEKVVQRVVEHLGI